MQRDKLCGTSSLSFVDDTLQTQLKKNKKIILALSERQLAQTEWLGMIRSLSGAVGLEVAQPVADTVRIGAGRVSLDMAQCDAALGGGAPDQQVVDELQQRSRRHAEPLSLVALALVGSDSGQCGLAVRVDVQGA